MSSSSADYPFGGDANQLKAWLISKYGEQIANIFDGWAPDELLGQRKEDLVAKAPANDIGLRLYGALETAKDQKRSGMYCFVYYMSLIA